MKILFTGASSFTGYWFVRKLAQAGHDVTCPITGELENYTEVRRIRVHQLKNFSNLMPRCSFGSDAFLSLAGSAKFDLLCHHAADVTNYKSPDFHTIRALQNNTHNLVGVLKTMACPVLLTGSVFENDEGAGDDLLNAFSPYGLSKGLTWQFFRYYCGMASLPLGKFVIPNPFGPYEEPRFTAFLLKNWKVGQPAEIKTPNYFRDNIHVDLLAGAYAIFAEKISKSNACLLRLNPSGYVEKQGAFAERIQRETRARTNWTCELKLARQENFSEPMNRTNTEPASMFVPHWNESAAWDAFVFYYAA